MHLVTQATMLYNLLYAASTWYGYSLASDLLSIERLLSVWAISPHKTAPHSRTWSAQLTIDFLTLLSQWEQIQTTSELNAQFAYHHSN